MWDSKPVRQVVRKLSTIAAVSAAILWFPTPGTAKSPALFVVNSDFGGQVGPRAIRIMKMRSQGRRVEITGSLCLSSCTMFLGAGNVCINPKTVFGFHGPSYYGLPLSSARFEYWSDVIASHYSAPLKSWYMRTARYKTSGFMRLSGAQLIELGYASCQSQALS
jgi:hypothetical protein